MPTGEPVGSTLNVGLFDPAIKGKGSPDEAVRRAVASLLLLEQLVGGGSMGGDCSHMLLDPPNLALQQLNAFSQFVLRHRPEVLLEEQR